MAWSILYAAGHLDNLEALKICASNMWNKLTRTSNCSGQQRFRRHSGKDEKFHSISTEHFKCVQYKPLLTNVSQNGVD